MSRFRFNVYPKDAATVAIEVDARNADDAVILAQQYAHRFVSASATVWRTDATEVAA